MVTVSRFFFFSFLFSLALSTPILSAEKKPCRLLGSYRFRYSFEDKNNPANNLLWAEDKDGFRIASFQGADCSKLALISDQLFWIEYPGRRINRFDLKTRFSEHIADGLQFSISPDNERMIVEKDTGLSFLNLENKIETQFFRFSKEDALSRGNAVFFYGWSSDGENFWFSLIGKNQKPLDLWVLTHKGDLLLTKTRPDPMEEAVFNLDLGWITQNNGTELLLFDLVNEKRILIRKFSLGERLSPSWNRGGNLSYRQGGQAFTMSKDELVARLGAAASSFSMIAKREFAPLSW